MLRVDNRVGFVRLPWTLGSMFKGRYAVASGRKVYSPRWKKAQIQMCDAEQQANPV
jgi:hypothetical protein